MFEKGGRGGSWATICTRFITTDTTKISSSKFSKVFCYRLWQILFAQLNWFYRNFMIKPDRKKHSTRLIVFSFQVFAWRAEAKFYRYWSCCETEDCLWEKWSRVSPDSILTFIFPELILSNEQCKDKGWLLLRRERKHTHRQRDTKEQNIKSLISPPNQINDYSFRQIFECSYFVFKSNLSTKRPSHWELNLRPNLCLLDSSNSIMNRPSS